MFFLLESRTDKKFSYEDPGGRMLVGGGSQMDCGSARKLDFT